MKKIISFVLAFLLAFSLCACGGNKADSAAKNFVKLETDAWQEIVNALFANSQQGGSLNTAASGSMDIIVGEKLLPLLSNVIPKGLDLSWLKKLNFDFNMQASGNLMKQMITYGLNDKPIASADIVMDMMNTVYYMALPDWSNKYIKLDMNALTGSVTPGAGGGNAPVIGGADIGLGNMSAILDAIKLPEGTVLADTLMKYIRIVYNNLTDVTTGKETVKVNGKDKTFSTYNVKITEEIASLAVIAVLREAKTDTVLKGMMPEGVEYEAAIDSLLAQVEADKDYDTKSYFNMVLYVDNNKVVGRKINLTEEQGPVVELVCITSGDVVELSLTAGANTFSFRGAKGTYALYMAAAGQEIALVDVKTTGDSKKGSLVIAPTEFASQLIFKNNTEISLELTWDNTATVAKAGIAAYLDKGLLVAIEITAQEATSGTVTLPTDVVDATNQQALNGWLQTIDMQALLNKLVKAGVPQSVIDLFTKSQPAQPVTAA